jgi:hypothetical protein
MSSDPPPPPGDPADLTYGRSRLVMPKAMQPPEPPWRCKRCGTPHYGRHYHPCNPGPG